MGLRGSDALRAALLFILCVRVVGGISDVSIFNAFNLTDFISDSQTSKLRQALLELEKMGASLSNVCSLIPRHCC